MIQLEHGYTKLFTATVEGVGTAADSTPAAVLYRNGSASGVTVTVSTTGVTGLYKATFTTLASGDGWSESDHLELYATATIDSTSGYLALVWSSLELANTTTPLDATATQSAAAAAITAANLALEATSQTILEDTGTTLPASLTAIANSVAAVKADTATLLGRITAAAATLFVDLAAMITGSGASAKYTSNALSLAPTGGGGSSGSGPNTVTVTVVNDADDTEIVGADVLLTLGVDNYSTTTDGDGIATLRITDGIWNVAVSRYGWQQELTVLIDTATESTVEVRMAATTSGATTDPDLSTVKARHLDPSGNPIAGSTFRVKMSTLNSAVSQGVMSRTVTTDTTDADGYAELVVARAAAFVTATPKYEFEMIDADDCVQWAKKVSPPTTSEVWLETLS